MRVKYPPGNVTIMGERIIHVESPESSKRINELETEIQLLRNAPPKIIEKITEIKIPIPDKEIEIKYHNAIKQIEALEKARLATAQIIRMPENNRIKYIPQEQTKLVEVPKLVFIKNKKLLIFNFIIGAIIGSLMTTIILMASHVR